MKTGKKNTQPQEVTQIESQQEFMVTLANSKQGTATVDQHGGITLNNGSFTEGHSFTSLVNKARRNTLPEWVKQIPGLISKIEAVFDQERSKGIDPFTQYSNSDGKLVVTNLKTGTSLGAPIKDLKQQLAQTGKLSRVFDTPRAKELLGLAA